MLVNPMRRCGQCGWFSIPRGLDWPFWKAGEPVCESCVLKDGKPDDETPAASRSET